MNIIRTPENELWDDAASEHPRIFHKVCGGRVVWVTKEEFRCFSCGRKVHDDDMEIPDEPLLNGVK